MKIAVFSDSHGNLTNLEKAAKKALDADAEIFIHLGDDYRDAGILDAFALPVIKVPGAYDQEYTDHNLSNRLIKEFENVKILITHTPSSHENDSSSDLKPEKVSARKEVQVILYGHTHRARIEQKEGICWINPGHLKEKNGKGSQPSFALLEIKDGKTNPKIIFL